MSLTKTMLRNVFGKLAGESVHRLLILSVCLSLSSVAQAVGLMPVPTLKNVTTQASATYDPVKQWYNYHYSVNNPATNTGKIWDIDIDISRRFIGGSVRLNPNGLMLPMETRSITFSKMLAVREPLGLPPGQSVVSIGQRVPAGWDGGFGTDGYAGFSAGEPTVRITPGSSLGGFVLISPGLPTIRKMQIIPKWVFVVPDIDKVTDRENAQAAAVERNIIFHTHTLGPAGVTNFGGFSHWNLLRDDIEKAITLGWIPDTALAGTIRTKLAFARKALDAQDGTLAKTRLQTLLATMQAITPGQKIRREAYDLIVLNIRSLLKHTANTPIPFKPAYSLTPPTSTLPLGKRQTLIARAFNVAFNNAPIPGEFFEARITKGPHMGLSWFLQTDANGEAPFSYVGKKVGKDHIIISRPLGLIKKKPVMLAFTGNLSTLAAGGTLLGGPPPLGGGATGTILAEAEVIWKGGPDLVVPFFMPPIIKSQGGNTVFITEVTANTGNLASTASTTRYYLSDSKVIDPNIAMVVGDRLVDPLQPGQSSGANTLKFTIPGTLPAGIYYMAACADADQGVEKAKEKGVRTCFADCESRE